MPLQNLVMLQKLCLRVSLNFGLFYIFVLSVVGAQGCELGSRGGLVTRRVTQLWGSVGWEGELQGKSLAGRSTEGASYTIPRWEQ